MTKGKGDGIIAKRSGDAAAKAAEKRARGGAKNLRYRGFADDPPADMPGRKKVGGNKGEGNRIRMKGF